MRQRILQTGVWLWDGLPGSGKSYGAVDLLINTILRQRRPVYTNLPIKFRVLAKYLTIKGSDARLAQYILPLDWQHFLAFIQRNHERQEFVEVVKRDGISEAHGGRMYDEQVGAGVIRGSGANWLPAGAVVIIDEAHLWFDQKQQKMETPALLRYVTMHRHHMHWVHILTQDKMQVSLTWRRNTDTVIHCADKRKLPFIFGLPLPIPAFSYEYWPKEYADSQDHGRMQPTRTEVKIPWLGGSLIWRFYSSFVHMGSQRRLFRELNHTRDQIEGSQTHAKEPDMPKKFNAWKWVGIVAVVLVVVVGAYVGPVLLAMARGERSIIKKPTAENSAVVASVQPARDEERERRDAARKAEAAAHAAAQAMSEARQSLPVVSGLGDGVAIVNGAVVPVQTQVNGWRLEGIDLGKGVSLWVHAVAGPATVGVGMRAPSGTAGGPGQAHGGTSGKPGRDMAQFIRDKTAGVGDRSDGGGGRDAVP